MLNRALCFLCLLLGLTILVIRSSQPDGERDYSTWDELGNPSATAMAWDDNAPLTGTASAAVRGPLPLVSTSDTTGRQDNAIFLPRWSCDEESGAITITAMIGSHLTIDTRALCRAMPERTGDEIETVESPRHPLELKSTIEKH
jgi:hypothetical protein